MRLKWAAKKSGRLEQASCSDRIDVLLYHYICSLASSCTLLFLHRAFFSIRPLSLERLPTLCTYVDMRT